jgi:hypothetical protein
MPFRINTPHQGKRPKYYLIHASSHIRALMEMKDSMAKYSDSEYKFEAIGLLPNQLQLFENPDKITLRERIKDYIEKKSTKYLKYENIQNWAYINTIGVRKTINVALLELANNKNIEIIRKSGQRPNTITEGAIIKFLNR